jgi:hypothetical protein
MIGRGEDGYYHPGSVAELSELATHAHAEGVGLRVRGSRHSVGAAVHNDGYDGQGAPPDGPLELMMDNLRKVDIGAIGAAGDGRTEVEVEAGCHLGRSSYDPTGTSTWQNSLNYQLQSAGLALDDLGGISHQTVSGFMMTGSAGGSIQHTLVDDIVRLLLVDGTGKVHDVRRDDPDPAKRDLFHAAGVSMGLLGVVAKVWLRVGASYNVVGREVTSRFEDCAIDLLGEGVGEQPGLQKYLEETQYTRLLWWPQHNFNRVQVWQCSRAEQGAQFVHNPFVILTKVEALAGSLIMTVLGNLDDLTRVPEKLGNWYRHLESDLDGDDEDMNACTAPQRGGKVEIEDVLGVVQKRFARAIDRHPTLNEGAQHAHDDVKELWQHRGDDADDDEGLPAGLARAITKLVRWAMDGILEGWLGKTLGRWLKKELPDLIDNLLTAFVENGVKEFSDTWMCALPMDNQMDDQLWPTEFTELWLPIEHTMTAMQRLAEYFGAGGDPEVAFKRTRAYATELYAAAASPFWLSPSYGTNVFRVDPFWFNTWAGHPNDEFFPPFYDLLKDLDFRPHWGKYLPPPSDAWRAHYRKVLPRLDDFLKLRAQLDPKDIFLTTYWREHLGA